LKITAEKDQQSQYVVRIEIDAAEFDEAKGKAAKRLSNKVRIPGFRPGKAPRALVERFIGQEALVEETTRDLMPKAYKEALSQKNIKPIGEPNITVDSYDPFTIVATIPVEPTVTLGNYREVKFEMPVIEDNEEEVEKTIQQLRDQSSIWEEPEEPRPAQENDQVELELQTIREGEPTGEPFPRTGILGKGELLEQMDEQIIGMIVGEGRIIEVARSKPQAIEAVTDTPEEETSDEDDLIYKEIYQSQPAKETPEATTEANTAEEAPTETPELPEVETIPLSPEKEANQDNKPLVFQVTLNSIKVKHEPELNDEFAASVSDLATIEELRERIRANLKAQAESQAKSELLEKIVKEIVDLSHVDVPPIMVHSQIHALEENVSQRLKQQKLSLEQYLQVTGKSHEIFHEELRPQAENQVRTSLILQELAQQEGLTVDQRDVEQEVERLVIEYSINAPEEARAEQVKRLREVFRRKETLDQITNDVFSRKLSEHLIELATGIKPVLKEPKFTPLHEEKVVTETSEEEPKAIEAEVILAVESSAEDKTEEVTEVKTAE